MSLDQLLMSKLNVKKDRRIYGNYQVESPDGVLMFRCDQKKANWYLNKNLASIVDDNQFIIRLNFEPKGLGNHDKPYGLVPMDNICVNCGTDEFLTRHHIVPICYRRHFPLKWKSHNFHDVLSLCIECHENYERKADDLKMKLSEKYNAPIGGLIFKDERILKISKQAATLLGDVSNIPIDRINKLEVDIKEYLSKDYTYDDLQELMSMSHTKIEKSHGNMVMEQINDIQEFIELWRNHFIDNNKCEYLPINWNVKNKIIIDEDN